jgi:hypothetical protein
MERILVFLLCISFALLASFRASGQSGGIFEIKRSVIAGGGGLAGGDIFSLDGTIGEPVAGTTISGGIFSAEGGFWSNGAAATQTATPTDTPTSTPTATPTATPAITGYIDYAIVTKPVPGVVLDAPGSIFVTGTTDSLGNYLLTGFGAGPYTITPTKTAQQCSPPGPNGIFSNDASLISQHVVGLIIFTPDQLIAADVSGLHSISSLDASLVAQKVVGRCIGMNRAGHWAFSPDNVAHPEGVSVGLVENYRAYMFGDVSGDWNPTGFSRPAETVLQNTDTVTVSLSAIGGEPGSLVTMPLRFDNLQNRSVDSYQFDIAYDPAVVEPARIAADITGTNSASLNVVWNSPQPGLLKVAVYGAIPTSGDGVYVDLKFNILGASGSSSEIHINEFRLNDGREKVASVSGLVTVH